MILTKLKLFLTKIVHNSKEFNVKKFLKIGAIALVITLMSTGCRTSPILNVPNQVIVAPSNKVTSNDVYKAIVRAGASLGWKMQKTSDGVILGTLNLRDHQAVVVIKYTKGNYSIMYKSSKNLKFDAEDQTIHSNYNGWIENLENAINAQVNFL